MYLYKIDTLYNIFLTVHGTSTATPSWYLDRYDDSDIKQWIGKWLEEKSQGQIVYTPVPVKDKVVEMGGWRFYFSDEQSEWDMNKVGKWMFFFTDVELAKEMCIIATDTSVVQEAKHSIELDPIKKTGVACFYCHGDDDQAHKRVIQFFLDNGLIPRTKNGKYYNISFKYDNQTRNDEYGKDFESKIKLERFIDLFTGEWLV